MKIPPTGIPLDEIERQALVEALKMSNWVQKDAAELLAISPRVMNYKIKTLGIEMPRRRDADGRVTAIDRQFQLQYSSKSSGQHHVELLLNWQLELELSYGVLTITVNPYRSGERPVNARSPDTGQLPLIHGYGFEMSAQNTADGDEARDVDVDAHDRPAILPAQRDAVQPLACEVLHEAVVARQLLSRDRDARRDRLDDRHFERARRRSSPA